MAGRATRGQAAHLLAPALHTWHRLVEDAALRAPQLPATSTSWHSCAMTCDVTTAAELKARKLKARELNKAKRKQAHRNPDSIGAASKSPVRASNPGVPVGVQSGRAAAASHSNPPSNLAPLKDRRRQTQRQTEWSAAPPPAPAPRPRLANPLAAPQEMELQSPVRAEHTQPPDPELKSPVVEQTQPPLTAEQSEVLAAAATGANVFVTGEAGTGKTVVLSAMIAKLVELHGADSVFVAASTGHAASLLSASSLVRATTVHSFAGVGIDNRTPASYRSNPPHADAAKRWRKAKVLVIDEISMLGARMFDTLESIAETARDCSANQQLPFAGLQLIVAGDFLQLPPVGGEHTFAAAAWARCAFANYVLKQGHRQSDPKFRQILSELRVGQLPPRNHEWLVSSCREPVDETDGVLATKLYATNVPKDADNDTHLQQLPGPLHTYIAQDTPGTAEELLRKCRARKKLHLKVGAQVVCLKNLPGMGLVNGSRGVVTRLNDAAAVVKFHGVGERSIKQMWIPGHNRKQLPLDLAWALTIHSSQGMTLDKVVVDLSRTFAPGMTYTALSRARSVEMMQVLALSDARTGLVDPKVLEFMKSIEVGGVEEGDEEDEDCEEEMEETDAMDEASESDSWCSVAGEDMEHAIEDIDLEFVTPAPPKELSEVLISIESFLVQYLVVFFVNQKSVSWEQLSACRDQLLAYKTDEASLLELLHGLVPLAHWSTLPEEVESVSLSFAAMAKLVGKGDEASLEFELQWPEIAHRRFQTGSHRGVIGYTKRIFRRYGAENVFTIMLPSGKGGGDVADRLKGKHLDICGRRFGLSHLKPDSPNCCMVFRVGIPCSNGFDTWHLDPAANPDTSVVKALARSKHSYSSIVPTITISPEQILFVDDPTLEPFTDGCCGIGAELFERVWKLFQAKTGIADDDDGGMPSVFQGRLGPMKGVWYLDRSLPPDKISYRASMKKYEIENPTVEQLCIEVCCFGLDSGQGAAALNKQVIQVRGQQPQKSQLITSIPSRSLLKWSALTPRLVRLCHAAQVLKDRVADPAVFATLFQDVLHRKLEALTCKKAAEKFCKSRGSGQWGGQVMEKLHAGFKLEHELVQGLLTKAIKWSAGDRVALEQLRYSCATAALNVGLQLLPVAADNELKELHLKLPQSRRYILLADITGTLAPGEIVVKSPVQEQVNRTRDTIIFRNPIYDSAEILACTAVDPHEAAARLGAPDRAAWARGWFADQQNVVIVSTQPDRHGRSVVEAMQGADFDGDTVTVIWDPRIVDGFLPAPGGDLLYSEPVKKHLATVTLGQLDDDEGRDRGGRVWEAFKMAVEGEEMIGKISKLHERWAAFRLTDSTGGLNENGRCARQLADMAHKALDARKAGYLMPKIPQQLEVGAPPPQLRPNSAKTAFDRAHIAKADTSSLFGCAAFTRSLDHCTHAANSFMSIRLHPRIVNPLSTA